MRSSTLAILLVCLAVSSAYAQNCLLTDNCAYCTLDTFCDTCNRGYQVYDGRCYSCPSLCASCSADGNGETTCTGLYWYLYAIIAAVVLSILICCCKCCCSSKQTVIVKRQTEHPVLEVQIPDYAQQRGWNQPIQQPFMQQQAQNGINVNY